MSGREGDAVGDAHLRYGIDVVRSKVCACPELTESAAKELSRECALLKGRRKARRELGAARDGKREDGA